MSARLTDESKRTQRDYESSSLETENEKLNYQFFSSCLVEAGVQAVHRAIREYWQERKESEKQSR